MRLSLFCGVAAAAIAVPVAVHAQDTTSAIRGVVTSGGAPVAGAAVVAVHQPSGTRSATTTDANGSFSISGVRVGGPFTVSVNENEAQVTDIFTNVGQSYDLPIEVGGDEIVVTAANVANAGSISQGPATLLNSEQIANIATVNRDIRDLARRDPFARLDDTPGGGRAVSFAGQNARFNRFSVDGVPITDNFGLNPDGLPSRRSPIPLDAIGQFQTKVAPFDVREGNFQGGAINIVLRSGTNDFQGTGFYAYSSDKLTGDQTKDISVNLPKFKIENYGVELSGPIIKDKLFFMVAGERIRAGTPIPEGTIENNAGTPILGLTQATVDQITEIANSRYGYDPGGVLNNSDDKDDRLVAKIDANLSDTQRASITYGYTKDSIKFNQNSFTTPPPGLGLESNGYVASNRLHTGVVQLNSDWSDNFSTEFRGFYKDYKRGQDPIMGRGFAQMRICAAGESDRDPAVEGNTLATNCAANTPIVSIGPDVSRQSNQLTSKTFGMSGLARLTIDDHDIKFFVDYQSSKIFNLFLQRTAGDYYFDSIADFAAGNAQRLQYQNAIPSLDPNNAAARFSYQSYTFGLQDSWRLTDTLNLSYGARYDLYGGESRPELNPNFLDRFGFANSAYISGRGLFQPRLGFDWKPADRLVIRGGGGVFGGGSPDVYISNSFSTTGILSNAIDIRHNNDGSFSVPGLSGTPAEQAAQALAIGNAGLTNVDGTTISSAVNNYLLGGTVATGSPTNALDPNFKIPSQWRATVSADYDADLGPLGDGWNFGVDLFYSKVRNQVLFTDIRSVPIPGSLTPDGRQRYFPVTGAANDSNSDILLTNTKKGRSYIGVARLRKDWDFGLNAGIAFAYQDIKDQAPATSSTASSNYSNGAFVDPNIVSYGRSNDEVKYAFKYDLTFERAFFGDYKTTIALFGETRAGHPYSYTFIDRASGRSPVFGTIGTGSRYLLYVPTANDPNVSYDSADTQNAFEAFIGAAGLGKYRGSILPRNAFRSKWYTRIDLHLSQEIPTGLGGSRVTLFADVENFTNLLNKNWGQIREYAFPYNSAPVTVQCLTAPVATGATPGQDGNAPAATSSAQGCAQYRYSQFTNPSDTVYTRQSLYAIRVGARFSF